MVNNIFEAPLNFRVVDARQEISLPEKIKSNINKLWASKLATNSHLFNGPIYSIGEIVSNNDYIDFNMYRSSYAHYLHSKSKDFIGDHICRSIAVSALLLTADNFYCLGMMSEHTSYPNVIQCPGGAIDKVDIKGNVFDTWATVYREVQEEIGLDLEDRILNSTKESKYLITRKNLSYIGIGYVIELSINKNQLENIFLLHNENSKGINELQKLLFVRKDKESVLNFIEEKNIRKIDYLENLLLVDIGQEKCNKWE